MLGSNIANIRKQRGMTLSELADKTGVSKSYLSNLERDLKQNPSIQVLEKIAKELNVNLRTLLKMNENIDHQPLEKEWIDLIEDFKENGIDKESLREYKILIEFLKWYNEKKENEQ